MNLLDFIKLSKFGTMKIYKKSISHFLKSTDAFTLDDFLRQFFSYCKKRLKCDGVSIFFYSSAIDKLELFFHSQINPYLLSLKTDEGTVGSAFKTSRLAWGDGDESENKWLDANSCPEDKIRGIIALPLNIYKIPFAIICFQYHEKNQPPFGKLKKGFYKQESKTVKTFWKESKSANLGRFIKKLRLQQITTDLRSTGEAPTYLKSTGSEFIAKLQKAFKTDQQPIPPFIGIQIVDHQQQKINSLHSVGMPLGYEYAHSIPFSSDDIHADILRTRKIEIISGNDTKRFDQTIFSKYSHDKYIRLFMPLFPINYIYDNKNYDNLKIETLLNFSPKKNPHRFEFTWNKKRPPQALIYGTLELGYIKKGSGMSPWNKELAYWVVKHALELSKQIYDSTFSGILDKIGILLASVPDAALKKFTCEFPGGIFHGLREYPIQNEGLLVLPKRMPVKNYDKGEAVDSDKFIPCKPISLTYRPINLKNFPKEIKNDLKCISKIAAKAVDIALRLLDSTIVQHEFLYIAESINNVGTLFHDKILDSVCNEALLCSGANCCMLYRFTKRTKPYLTSKNDKLWLFGSPISAPKSTDVRFLVQSEEETIHKVAQSKMPIYSSDYESNQSEKSNPYCLLPMEIIDGPVCVLLLCFSRGYLFNNQEKFNLENQVVKWVARLSMRHLILRQRFSDLMMRLRITIQEISKSLEQSTERRMPIFLEKLLIELVKLVNSNAASITVYYQPKTGTEWLRRFICCRGDDENEILSENHDFINAKLEGPCHDACVKSKIIIIHQRNEDNGIINVVNAIERIVNNNGCSNEKRKTFQQYSNWLTGDNTPSTVITFPIPEWNNDQTILKASVTIVLPKIHYLDFYHKHLIDEIGALIAETMRHIRHLDSKDSETIHLDQFEQRRLAFEKAKHPDEIIGILLAGMGRKITFSKMGAWNLAEDVIIWNLDWGNKNLIVRSARGNGMAAFQNTQNLLYINCDGHPMLKKEGIFFTKNKPPRLRSKFQLWTFALQIESKYNPLCHAYLNNIGCQILVSFPIVDATDRIHGVIDLLLDTPFYEEEGPVFKRLFYRMSHGFCNAVDKCQKSRIKKITDDLYYNVKPSLLYFQTDEIYSQIVIRMKKEFQGEHCDLFIVRGRKMLLQSTTREKIIETNKLHTDYWIKPDESNREILGACFYNKKPILFHSGQKNHSYNHVSKKLRKVICEDFNFERMAFPIMTGTGHEETIIGILHIRGPVKLSLKQDDDKAFEKKTVKKSTLFTYEDYLLCLNLCVSIQRIIQMANLVERQGGLVLELAHSIEQPLQFLRSPIQHALRLLPWNNPTLQPELINIKNEIYHGFHLAIEAKDHIGWLARSSHRNGKDIEYQFEKSDLSNLIRQQCHFMNSKASQDGIPIYCNVKQLKPLPFHKDLMKKVIINLLDNACKYSWSNKYINVRGYEHYGKIKIIVTNFGVGIPKEQMNRIFEPYYRARVLDAKGKRSGSGIGLGIVKEVIEKIHKGTVTAESYPNKPINTNQVVESMEVIENVAHLTKFIIILNRETLEQLNLE
ncbi:HAMP domain-containing sensor histidine kinase [Desulfococcaceae bacterium HSG9]|nr:HAMP domain-containing sensor histidine kinase [Desulfococcaceae bacterium HSG9]